MLSLVIVNNSRQFLLLSIIVMKKFILRYLLINKKINNIIKIN